MNRFILHMDIEHPSILLDREEATTHVQKLRSSLDIYTSLSGAPCLSQGLLRIRSSHIERLPLLCIIIGGNKAPWERYGERLLKEALRIVRDADVPILGICGGHQLLAMALGGRVAPIRSLGEDEHDDYPEQNPGFFREQGFMKVRILSNSPIFGDMPPEITVSQSHYCEVKSLPPELVKLAESDGCGIQALAHRNRPLFGVQFHPERYDRDHPHGRAVLENFFRIARRAST